MSQLKKETEVGKGRLLVYRNLSGQRLENKRITLDDMYTKFHTNIASSTQDCYLIADPYCFDVWVWGRSRLVRYSLG